MNNLSKIIFSFKKPKTIILIGKETKKIKEAISQVLKYSDKKALIVENDLTDIQEIKFLIKNSSLPILVMNDMAEPSLLAKEAVKAMPARGFLLFNFDNEKLRELKKESISQSLTFGFQIGANFQATDLKINGGVNFKINYRENIIPFWLNKTKEEEEIYSALTAIGIGTIFDLNLVEISQALQVL